MSVNLELDRIIANRNIIAEALRGAKRGTDDYTQLEKELEKYSTLIENLTGK